MRTFQKLIIWIRETTSPPRRIMTGNFDLARDGIGRGSRKTSPSSYNDCQATVTLEDTHEVAQLSMRRGADRRKEGEVARYDL